jgi:hypothetical protein
LNLVDLLLARGLVLVGVDFRTSLHPAVPFIPDGYGNFAGWVPMLGAP